MKNTASSTVKEGARPERQPTDSDISVVLRYDGAPKTARETLAQLTEFSASSGLEDDSYCLGGTVERLERKFAEMLGKDAAVFMPTGTLANHLAIRKHCVGKPRAIVQERSHLYNDTGDCVTTLSGINLVPLGKDRPCFTLDELKEAIASAERGRVTTPLGVVMIESPVRRQAGQVVPYDEMQAITEFCRERGIPTHLDGARLYMMSAATGKRPERYAALFDTVYVSLYKYFDAPFGAILAGTSEFTSDLYHDRRTFGASLATGGYLAAAVALNAIEGFEERFAAAIRKGVELFVGLNDLEGISVGRYEHGSNIFPVVLDAAIDMDAFIEALHADWVFVYPTEDDPDEIRFTINTTILRQSNHQLVAAFAKALARSREAA